MICGPQAICNRNETNNLYCMATILFDCKNRSSVLIVISAMHALPPNKQTKTKQHQKKHKQCIFIKGGAVNLVCMRELKFLSQQCFPMAGFYYHECGNGLPIPMEHRCDGEPDCADGSDERGCNSKFQLRMPLLQQHIISSHPLSPAAGQCDAFECSDGSQCLSLHSVCNGHPDCLDGSDESGCVGKVQRNQNSLPGYNQR